jgi:regulator of replication initiation timing
MTDDTIQYQSKHESHVQQMEPMLESLTQDVRMLESKLTTSMSKNEFLKSSIEDLKNAIRQAQLLEVSKPIPPRSRGRGRGRNLYQKV